MYICDTFVAWLAGLVYLYTTVHNKGSDGSPVTLSDTI